MRPEPRSMTAADMMALVAGVGLGIVLQQPVQRFNAGRPYPDRGVSDLVMAAAVAVSVVVIARLIRYGRRARPAEWLAILVAIFHASDRPEWQVDRAINLVLGSFMRADVSFSTLRWAMGGLAAMMILAGLGVLRRERDSLPPWFKTVATAWLAFLAIWGPIQVIGINGPDLLAPSSGFGAGLGPAVYWMICQHLAWVPFGLLFGVPLIAAIDGRVRRFPWAWTEWAGSITFLVALLVASTLRKGMVGGLSTLSAIEKGLDIAWFLGISLVSRWALIRLRPTWSRLFDPRPRAQASAAPPTSSSPARTA